MERVQGWHCSTDGNDLGGRSSPIQHDFFPYKILERKVSHNHPDGETCGLPDLHTVGHPSESANWQDSWKWDSVCLRAEPVLNTNNSDGQITLLGAQFPLIVERNAAPDDQTLPELGLMKNSSPVSNSDDGILALTLGSNDYGLDDQMAPNAKKSRHSPPEIQHPRCQVDGCNANLQNAKDYHRRHKVCEFHAKSSKALVSQVMQRFCQQCSRFHLLQEFDADRRSCRRRLAGHNRRRRKGQPDVSAALASLLGDQDSVSRLINTLQQLQGKEQLEQQLQVLGQTLQNMPAMEDTQTTSMNRPSPNDLLSAIMSGVRNAEARSSALEGASSDDLVTMVIKSQLLRNLLFSNSSITNNLLAVASSAPESIQIPPQISALDDALLSSTSQQISNDNAFHQRGDFSSHVGDQPEHCIIGSAVHVSAEQYSKMSSKEFNASNNNNNNNNNNRNDSRYSGSKSISINSSEQMKERKDVQNRKNGNGILASIYDEPLREERTIENRKAICTSVDTSINGFLMAERFAGGLEKQEQTFQLWFKIFDKSPADLPPTLREQMLDWLDHLPTEMEGYIRPGCIVMTVFVCMPFYAWEKLCNNIEENLYRLLRYQDGHFWCKGRILVHLGEASAFIIDGKVFVNNTCRLMNSPCLVLVQPFAVAVGETIDLILKGHNMEEPGTKFICAYEGNCIDRGLDSITESLDQEDEGLGQPVIPGKQKKPLTFHLGPFEHMGHGFIEVERHSLKGNTFPIIIADKPLCEEIVSLETEFTNSLENQTLNSGFQINEKQADIVHFLYELGWLLHRIQWNAQYTELKKQKFSPGKYRWLLQFSVKHGFCIVVKRILDFIFSLDSDAWSNTCIRTCQMLSEINLLHLAVSSNSRAMVETLLEYQPPHSSDFKQRYIFSPDARSHSGLTPLHIAACLHDAITVMDALTNAPKESWVDTWLSAKDSLDQTPLMYALATGNHECIRLVQSKIDQTDLKPSHVTLDIDSSLPKAPPNKQIQHCSCEGRTLNRNLSLKVHGLRTGSVYRPFVLSLLTIAAVCVCVGLLMKGPPSVSFIQGPFVWKFIKFGPI